MFDVQFARRQMIEQQVRAWDVLDLRVLEALQSVPREEFAPPPYRELAFADTARAARPRPGHAGAECRGPHPAGARDPARRSRARGRHGQRVLRRLPGTAGADRAHASRSSRTSSMRPPTTCVRTGAHNVTVDVFDAMDTRRAGRVRRHRAHGLAAGLRPALRAGAEPRAGACSSRSARAPLLDAQRITRTGRGEWVRESLFETAMDPLIHAPAATPVRVLIGGGAGG